MDSAESSTATRTILERNRQNAQHSTGPITPQGKAISSRNSLRHGITGIFTIIDGERREAFDELYQALDDEFQPATEAECLCIQNLAQQHWLVQRAIRLQGLLFTVHPDLFSCSKELAVLIRYQTTNQRAFHKSLDEIRKLQKERRQSETAAGQSGSVSQQDPAAGSVSQEQADSQTFQTLRERYGDKQLLEIINKPRQQPVESPQSAAEGQ